MTQIETKIFEKYIVDRLMGCLPLEAKFLRFGEAGKEADVIVLKTDGKEQGIEVVTAYKNEVHAKAFWDKIKNKSNALDEYLVFLNNYAIHHKDVMQEKLQNEINRKCTKSLAGNYGEGAWLCIFENSPSTNNADIKIFTKNLKVPKSNFEKIIILNESMVINKFEAFELT